MKKIIKKIKEKIQSNVLLHATVVLAMIMLLNFIFEILQKLKK